MQHNHPPLELRSELLIGSGTHRLCYQHPDDEACCIKLPKPGAIPREQNRALQREWDMYQVLGKRQINWDMLARQYGTVATNLGEGVMYELVRDSDGSVSCTLEKLLHRRACIEDTVVPALRALRRYMLEYRILTSAIHESNMVFQYSREASGRLVLIDDIGNTDFLPLRTYSAYLARNKIKRKWTRFSRRLADEFGLRL